MEKKELQTPQIEWAIRFAQYFYKDLKSRGLEDIDDCLVMCNIVCSDLFDNHPPNISEISKATGIPRSKVSRVLAAFLENGDIEEVTDDDGRKHPVHYTSTAFLDTYEWAIDFFHRGQQLGKELL